MKLSQPVLLLGLFGFVAVAALLILLNAPGPHDEFAKCVTASGAKMYGTYWCAHCKEQKEMFGASFRHIDYVECSLPQMAGQTEECAAAGIRSYPTWEFGDGTRESGALPFEELSAKTACPLEP